MWIELDGSCPFWHSLAVRTTWCSGGVIDRKYGYESVKFRGALFDVSRLWRGGFFFGNAIFDFVNAWVCFSPMIDRV